ncbi:DoxX family protein [Rhizobium leguminosarum]
MITADLTQKYQPHALAVLRIVAALIFFEHGTQKLFNFPASDSPATLGPLMLTAGILELVGGLLLLVGFKTRIVAFVLSGQMAFAYFIGHFPRDFFPILNRGDAAILYCFVFLYIAVAGAGTFSIDGRRQSA